MWLGLIGAVEAVISTVASLFRLLPQMLFYMKGKQTGRQEVIQAQTKTEAEINAEYAQIATDSGGNTPSDTADKLSRGNF